jgi:flagellar hook capping protein FlgD
MIPARVPIPRITRMLLPAATLCLFAATALPSPPGGPGALSRQPRIESTDFVPAPVQIRCPVPHADTMLLVPPNLQILWDAVDHGHGYPRMPFQYRFILLGPGSEFPVVQAIVNPESFRDYYANHPLGAWSGWDSTDAHTREVRYTNLIPGQPYLFAVIALDRDGRYSPDFRLDANMLQFVPGYPANSADWSPVLSVHGPGLNFQYPQGGFCVCPSTEVPTQVRAGQHLNYRWSADAGYDCGSLRIRWYRWALDIADVFDETPRIDEATDLAHWSVKSPDATSASLGPFGPGEVHRLYIEASDDIGLLSLGIVRIEVLPPAPLRRIELTAQPPRGGVADVSYSLTEPAQVDVAVYDVAGRRVATLESTSQAAGTHRLTWDARGFGQGMYFYRLRAGSEVVTRSVLLLK